jgi:hypothetical protein
MYVDNILKFEGEYRFLSNFWETPISYMGFEFGSVEAAYQAAKAVDPIIARSFTSLNPAQAKQKGRTVIIRADWNEVRLAVMEELVRIKFQDQDLKTKLLATGNALLVEGNWWKDQFWGIYGGIGENHLGKILMKVRQELTNG